MKPFLDANFLLDTKTAQTLYHEVAKVQPIIDYHCHLPPALIADDHRFSTITELWLEGDHYKWRAMRANGVDERFITGDASPWEKFEAWAKTVPHTLRNPLFHWTHLELKFPFGIEGKLLGPGTAPDIYERCNRLLSEDGFTARGLLRKYNVLLVCTTDDPVDTLEAHERHQADQAATTVLLPTWRPDKVLGVHDLQAWNAWIGRLEAAAGVSIYDYDALLEALKKRHDFFHEHGCRLSDHGLEAMVAASYSAGDIASAFSQARAGKALSEHQAAQLRSALLFDMALWDHERAWTQQFHLGAMRNVNSRGARQLGADSGFDTIGDFRQGPPLARFLDRLDESDQLAKTILYNLNPTDNELFAALIGSFQDGRVAGKMQYGSAWWFLDQREGMERQINALSNMGLLSRFVGMLTDSRSFVSYSRHEYFRRLLCNLIGSDVESGLLPNDEAALAMLVRDVCVENARRYFGFDLKAA